MARNHDDDKDDRHPTVAPAAVAPADVPVEHYKTTQEEQLERSAEVEAAGGMANWTAQHYPSTGEKPHAVPGVAPVKTEPAKQR